MKIHLHEIAYGRSGDKGKNANVAIIAYTERGYIFLTEYLTQECMHRFFYSLGPKKTERFEVPNLLALNFVFHHILDGGGSLSLRVDAQGKVLAQAALLMSLDVDEELLCQMKA